jgi:hypothetical protein
MAGVSGEKMITARPFERISPILSSIQKIAWALFLVFLPVSSFPFFPPVIGGGALVRPLSIYPLILLMALVTLPRLIRQPIPRTLVCLLPFIAVATISSLLSLLQGVEPALGISVTERILRALLTLGIGVAFYFTVALYSRTPEDLRAALRWMYVGLGLALLWGSLQTIYVLHYDHRWFTLLNQIQGYISSRRLINTRVSGLTYEPNWFAEQLSFLFIPWLLAAVLSGTSAFRWRWRWITVELFLLGWAVAVLAFTFSRAGLMNLAALGLLGLLFLRPHRSTKREKKSSSWKIWIIRIIEAIFLLVMFAGMIRVAGTKNAFFARLWGYWTRDSKTSLSGYFEYLGFGARFVYGTAAYNTFSAYPVFGVGLGNYGFYFEEMLPDRPLGSMPEVLRILTPDAGRDRLITAKVLYLRLLAETGLVGTAAFFAFLVAVLGCALYLMLSPNHEQKYWGRAGLLGLAAFLVGAFSFDSFAIPNMWIVFGLITSSAWVYMRQPAAEAITIPGEPVKVKTFVPAQGD